MNRRFSSNYRRYPHSNMDNADEKATKTNLQEIIKRIEDIPLPNLRENTSEPYERLARHFKIPFKKFFSRIGFEEILLIGLIFLFLNEGIEDDFILIILIYVLITGIEEL